MSVTSKKITSSDAFFTEKIRLEQAVIDFEKMILEASVHLDTIDTSLEVMHSIASENQSAYFLQRVKKLHVLFHSLKHKKGYAKEDFDPIYHILEKIKNEDRIEFLNAALKNRINQVAKTLIDLPLKHTKREIDLKGKTVYTAFQVEGVHFLFPKRPFRILKNIPAFKSNLSIHEKNIQLFPGPGFILEEEKRKGLKKNVLLVKVNDTNEIGFYYDQLLEDWAISKEFIDASLKEEKGNEKILGKIRRKGINYHIIKLV